MTEAEGRLDDLIRTFVADHLPSFLALLCDQGLDPDEQRRRADRLVRSLRAAEIAPNLQEGGRRIIAEIDEKVDPPEVVFNEQFVENVDPSEALGLLETPIERILDVTPFRVNLLLQIDDADTRKSLVLRARRDADSGLAGVSDLPSVVDLRLRVFLDRLRQAAEKYGAEPDFDIDLRSAIETVVKSEAAGWPAWEEVAEEPFLGDVLEQLDEAFAGSASNPSPKTTVEIFWESLELSPRSALRQAAELLRAERSETLHLTSTLRKLESVLRGSEGAIPESAADWREFREIWDEWKRLFRDEQRKLAWSPVRRKTPDLSVFEPPLESLGLDEPESLPWECPLLCWSVREKQALSDLLNGTRSTAAEQRDEDVGQTVAFETFSELRALESGRQTPTFALRPAPSLDVAVGSTAERTVRAVRACYGRLFQNFCRVSPSDQQSVLERLRSSYDGYFGDVQEVWDRRFQGWESLEPPGALRRLTLEIEHILGPATLLEPFTEPFDGEVCRIPSFVFVAAFDADASVTHVRVPLIAMRSAFEDSPAAIRAVEVPEEDGEPCRWLGDEALLPRDLVEMPTEAVLETVRGDAVQLQVERG